MGRDIQSNRSNGKKGWATIDAGFPLESLGDRKSLLDVHIYAESLLGKSNFPNAWADIIAVLDLFEIHFDLVTPRSVNGKHYCFSEYLHHLAIEKKSTKLKAASDLMNGLLYLEVALDLGLSVTKQLNEFYRLACQLKVSMLEDEILAGASRTGEATQAKKLQKESNKGRAIALAKEYKQRNPMLSKKDIARLLAKELPQAEKTIYKYLTE